MKADSTTIKIIAMLTVIANELFNNLDIAPGTYTAAELASNCRTGDKSKKPIYTYPERGAKPIDEDDELYLLHAWEPLTITADTFTCEFARGDVFALLDRFEQLAKATKKDKATFTREAAAGTVFYVDIPKEAKNAAKFVSDDIFYPLLRNIYLDISRAALVASDKYILTEIPIIIEGSAPDIAQHLFIDPKHLQNLIGRVKVNVTDNAVTYTNEAGKSYICEINNCKFPDYRRVYSNNLSRAGYIRFAPDAAKSAIKTFKRLAKRDICVIVSVEAGKDTAVLSYSDLEHGDTQIITYRLTTPALASFAVCLKAVFLARALTGWDGGMWYQSPNHPVIFDVIGSRAVLFYPSDSDEIAAAAPLSGNIAVLDRLTALSDTAPAPFQPAAVEDTPATPAPIHAASQTTHHATPALSVAAMYAARQTTHHAAPALSVAAMYAARQTTHPAAPALSVAAMHAAGQTTHHAAPALSVATMYAAGQTTHHAAPALSVATMYAARQTTHHAALSRCLPAIHAAHRQRWPVWRYRQPPERMTTPRRMARDTATAAPWIAANSPPDPRPVTDKTHVFNGIMCIMA